MLDITSTKNGNVQHSFRFLTHGSQSHSSNIHPGRHSESNPHSPAGHCRWDNSVLTSAPWSHPAHPRPRVVDGNLSPIPEQQLHAAGVHVEFAGSFIVLYVCVLSALRHLYNCDFRYTVFLLIKFWTHSRLERAGTCRGKAPPSCLRKTVLPLKSPTEAFIAAQPRHFAFRRK